MGLGDAKFAASIGLLLGWQSLLTGTFARVRAHTVYGGARLALCRAIRTSQLPLGPFMLVGAVAALVPLRL
jgi:leader peptidase (prepilin peptidase)/N-methyltransferase